MVLEGTSEDFITDNVDTSVGEDVTSAALDKVLDYGRRERKEITMDAFAREFLLPRSIVVKLHIDEGMTSESIALNLSAPISIVQQQLLD
ncbi:hypothetical protein CGH64_25885, partial [Vibrio parahaemolyticus]